MATSLQPTRRALIAGFSALAATPTLSAGSAFAKAPMQKALAPAYYRFKLGAFEATVISDGPLSLGAPQDGIFTGVTKTDFVKLLNDNYLPSDQVEMEQNTLLINTGDKLVLFDTGDGGSKMFGPKSGRQLANLKAAGIDPKDIDAVILTHAHPDHCWGLITAGNPTFPNAQIYLAQADFDFWTDEAKLKIDAMKRLHRRHARAIAAEPQPYRLGEGWTGGGPGRPGDVGTGPYRGPHRFRHHLAKARRC